MTRRIDCQRLAVQVDAPVAVFRAVVGNRLVDGEVVLRRQFRIDKQAEAVVHVSVAGRALVDAQAFERARAAAAVAEDASGRARVAAVDLDIAPCDEPAVNLEDELAVHVDVVERPDAAFFHAEVVVGRLVGRRREVLARHRGTGRDDEWLACGLVRDRPVRRERDVAPERMARESVGRD